MYNHTFYLTLQDLSMESLEKDNFLLTDVKKEVLLISLYQNVHRLQ